MDIFSSLDKLYDIHLQIILPHTTLYAATRENCSLRLNFKFYLRRSPKLGWNFTAESQHTKSLLETKSLFNTFIKPLEWLKTSAKHVRRRGIQRRTRGTGHKWQFRELNEFKIERRISNNNNFSHTFFHLTEWVKLKSERQGDRRRYKSRQTLRVSPQADWNLLAFHARLVQHQIDTRKAREEERTKEGGEEGRSRGWNWSSWVSKFFKCNRNISHQHCNLLTATAIARPNRKKMRKCSQKQQRPKPFSDSKHRRTTLRSVRCATIRFVAWTGWFHCTRMESMESWVS